MSDLRQVEVNQAPRLISVKGRLPGLSAVNCRRLSVFLVEANSILAEAPLSTAGSFQFHVAEGFASARGVMVVLAPRGADAQLLASRANLPRTALANARALPNGGSEIDFAGVSITKADRSVVALVPRIYHLGHAGNRRRLPDRRAGDDL